MMNPFRGSVPVNLSPSDLEYFATNLARIRSLPMESDSSVFHRPSPRFLSVSLQYNIETRTLNDLMGVE